MKIEALPPAHTPSAQLYAEVIRRLGRNARERDGDAGVLEAATAGSLWQALLSEHFSPAQEAALLMGLRVHGESAAMLAAFAHATAATAPATITAPACAAATVVMHAAGAARRQPSATPLLAQRLAQLGVPVLLITASSARAGHAAGVLRAMGEVAAPDAAAASALLATRGWAWIELGSVAPALARLMNRRAELGFRNSAHSVLKLFMPLAGPGLLLAAYTHAPYRATLAGALRELGRSACLVRGTEGDPVAWESESHPPLAWIAGLARDLTVPAPAARETTTLIAGDDAASAAWTRRVLAGDAPLPDALERQAQQLAQLARAAAAASPAAGEQP